MDKRDCLDFETMNISKLFSKILIPTLLRMVFSASINITDGIFVGHGVGSNGLAAINIVAPLYMITTGIGLMFGVGTSIVASIHLSQGKIKAVRINKSIIASFVIMVLISSLTLYFHKEVGYLFGSSDMLLPLVLEYMDWVVDKYQSYTKRISEDIPVLQEVVNSVWKKEDELKALKSDLATLDRKIQLSLKPIEQSEGQQEILKNKEKDQLKENLLKVSQNKQVTYQPPTLSIPTHLEYLRKTPNFSSNRLFKVSKL